MLTKKTPDTISARLRIKAQGVENDLLLTFHNRSPDEYEAFTKNPENLKTTEGVNEIVGIAQIKAAMVLFLVKSFDDGTDEEFPLNLEGLVNLERHWPGVLQGIMVGYHQARGAQVEKN